MGQKVNSIIFKTPVLKHWKSKYIEKKTSDLAYYNFRDLELQNFLNKVFEENGLLTNNIKINYHGNLLHVFISYYFKIESEKQVVSNLKKKSIKVKASDVKASKVIDECSLTKKNKMYLKQLFFNRFLSAENLFFKTLQIKNQVCSNFLKNDLNCYQNRSIIKKVFRKAFSRKLKTFHKLQFRQRFLKLTNKRYIKYIYRKKAKQDSSTTYLSGLFDIDKLFKYHNVDVESKTTTYLSDLFDTDKLFKLDEEFKKKNKADLKNYFIERSPLTKKNKRILCSTENLDDSTYKLINKSVNSKTFFYENHYKFYKDYFFFELENAYKTLVSAQNSLSYSTRLQLTKKLVMLFIAQITNSFSKKLNTKTVKFYLNKILSRETQILKNFPLKFKRFYVGTIKSFGSANKKRSITQSYTEKKSFISFMKKFPLSFVYLKYFHTRFLKRCLYDFMSGESDSYQKICKRVFFYKSFIYKKRSMLIDNRFVDFLLNRYCSKKKFYLHKLFFKDFSKFSETVVNNQFLNKKDLLEVNFYNKLKLAECNHFFKNGKLPKSVSSLKQVFENDFLKRLYFTINAFTEKKFSIKITLKQLKSTYDIVEVLKQYNQTNKSFRKKIGRKVRSRYAFLKRSKAEFIQFRQDRIFSETFKSMLAVSKNQSMAFFLSKFVARHLQMKIRKKRYNYYLRFLQSFLVKFCSLESQKLLRTDTSFGVKSVRIEIKGRLGNSNRAEKKIIVVGKGVQRISFKSTVDYASTVAYATNCTFGVKVWIQYYQDANTVWSWKKLKPLKKKLNPRKNHFFTNSTFKFKKLQFYKKKISSTLLFRSHLKAFKFRKSSFKK